MAVAQGPLPSGYVLEVLRRAARGAADVAVVALAFVTAVVAALPTVLADDTFGTWRDYLLALGLGGTAALAAKGVVDLAGRLGRRDRVEEAAAKPGSVAGSSASATIAPDDA